MNFSGRYYNIVPYGVDPRTELINYDELAAARAARTSPS
jgi:glycine/serine hydroxymethyltransferase